MTNKTRSTEDEIVLAAYAVFLLYGYHGTTLQQIAVKAGVNISAIHYYYRSKEKLYCLVVKLIIDLILNKEIDFPSKMDNVEKPVWFLFTELYNNRTLFENTVKNLYPFDWESKLIDLINWISFSNSPLNYAVSCLEKK